MQATLLTNLMLPRALGVIMLGLGLGLTVEDFHLLVNLGVFNATHMNQAVFAFRRYEDSSLSYTGIESHKGLRRYGLYDTVVAVDDEAIA